MHCFRNSLPQPPHKPAPSRPEKGPPSAPKASGRLRLRRLRLEVLGSLGAAALACSATAQINQPIIDRAHREVRFTATVQPEAMAKWIGGGVRGHHAITWRGGNAHDRALFVADASDHDVRAALDALGARRGENLTEQTWTARNDPKSPEPDKRVEGTAIDAFLEWNGHRVNLADVIREKGRTAPRLDLRYGGNERFQKDFHSGCIVCLYSCPGGAIGNHAHTIRDYARDGVVYEAIPERLPPEGTRVVVILQLAESTHPSR